MDNFKIHLKSRYEPHEFGQEWTGDDIIISNQHRSMQIGFISWTANKEEKQKVIKQINELLGKL